MVIEYMIFSCEIIQGGIINEVDTSYSRKPAIP